METNNRQLAIPHFHPTFCESIRAESSGQFTYVGIFQSKIIVQAFPHCFPQFSAAMFLIGTKAQLENVDITLAIGGTAQDHIRVPDNLLNQEEDDDPIYLNLHLTGGSLWIHEPCTIAATMTMDGLTHTSPNVIQVIQSTSPDRETATEFR